MLIQFLRKITNILSATILASAQQNLNKTCATSKDPDQPAHLHSLISLC